MTKKLVVIFVTVVTLGFALPTLEGTRGTNFVSSALCEDMGYLWFYMACGAYAAKVTRINLSGGSSESKLLALQPALVSIGFTPWHYLEFSVYGLGYFYHNSEPSISAYGLSHIGGHIKGSFPLNPLDKPVRFATGIDGFVLSSLPIELDPEGDSAIADYLLGGNPYVQFSPRFGAKGLFSVESQYFSGHLNTSYMYRSSSVLGIEAQAHGVMLGLGVESSPLDWMNLFVDLNLSYVFVRSDFGDTSWLAGLPASIGVRIPFKFGPRWMFHLGGGADPRDFKLTSTVYAGLAVGGDFIIPKEKFIEGIVINGETGEPIPVVMIELTGYTRDSVFYSDSLGKFVLPELLEGDTLHASKAGYHPETISAEEIGEKVVITLDPIRESYIALVISDAETDDPLSAAVAFVELETADTAASLTSDFTTGYCRTSLSPGRYRMFVVCPEYEDFQQLITIEPENQRILDIFLEPVATPEPPPELLPVAVSGFGRGERGLSFYQMLELQRVAELLEENPDATVVITGHTDSVGSDEVNISVGMERARRVAEFLAMRGIDARRIKAESGGERFPIADNRYRSGRAANRRVELYFSRNAEKVSSDGVTAQDSNLQGG